MNRTAWAGITGAIIGTAVTGVMLCLRPAAPQLPPFVPSSVQQLITVRGYVKGIVDMPDGDCHVFTDTGYQLVFPAGTWRTQDTLRYRDSGFVLVATGTYAQERDRVIALTNCRVIREGR